MTSEAFEEHLESYDGYCRVCKAWTRFGMTEPDAEDYPCDECHGNTCVGAEQAVILGLLDGSEED